MIPPVEINLNPETKPEMFGVTVERAEAICESLSGIATKAAMYYVDQYSIEGTGEFAGKRRLNEAKVIGELLAVAETTGEWCFILFSALHYLNDIVELTPRIGGVVTTLSAILKKQIQQHDTDQLTREKHS